MFLIFTTKTAFALPLRNNVERDAQIVYQRPKYKAYLNLNSASQYRIE